MIIWHNPRCTKSRQTLALLQENGVEPEVRLYLKDAPSEAEIRDVLVKLNLSPADMMRTMDAAFKALNLPLEDDAALIAAMVENAALIERPIVISDDRAALGRPPENVLDLL